MTASDESFEDRGDVKREHAAHRAICGLDHLLVEDVVVETLRLRLGVLVQAALEHVRQLRGQHLTVGETVIVLTLPLHPY